MHEGVFKVRNGHLWARYNPHLTREHWYKVRFSVRGWTGIVEDIVVGPYLPRNRLADQRYLDFLETVLPELLEDVPLAVKQSCGFSATELHRTVGVMSGRG
jgi:hypothetical protein